MTDLDLIITAFGPWAGAFALVTLFHIIVAVIQLRGK